MLRKIILGLLFSLILPTQSQSSDANKNTVLHLAVLGNNMTYLADCIESGFDVNAKDEEGRTPLMYALAKKNNKAIELLFTSSKLDISVTDNNGWTYEYYAVRYASENMLKRILAKGVSLDRTTDTVQNLAVVAMLADREDMLEFLLKINCSVTATDADGSTLLHGAATTANTAICDLLLAANADINACNNTGVTPLATSILLSPSLDVPRFLLEHNADPCIGRSGLSALNILDKHADLLSKTPDHLKKSEITRRKTLLKAAYSSPVLK